MRRIMKLGGVSAAFAALLMLAAMLGGNSTRTEAAVDPAVEAAIRADINRTITAWNTRNVTDFLNGFTDKGLMDVLEFESRAEAQQALPEFIGEDQISFVSLTGLAAGGSNASGYLLLAIGNSYEYSFQNFLFIDGRWKLAAATQLNPPVGAGTTVVNVAMGDYYFGFEPALLRTGNVAISATNVGTEEHELVMFRNTTGQPIRQVLENASEEEEPEGIEFFQAAFAPPGQTQTLVFTSPMPSGTYGFVCFIPTASGTPHFVLGMTADVVVGSGASTGGGGALRPPSTGDAGLARDNGNLLNVYTLLGASLLLVAIGVSGVALRRSA